MHTHMAKFIVTITVFSIKALTREAKLRQVSITSYFTFAVIGMSTTKAVVTWYACSTILENLCGKHGMLPPGSVSNQLSTDVNYRPT